MPFATHPQHRRVVFLLIDGARHDVLRALLAQGDLPNLARWVIEPGGMAVGTTVFPSTTGVAYIPFLFGRFPGGVGIPGIRWLDRRGAAGGWREQWRAAALHRYLSRAGSSGRPRLARGSGRAVAFPLCRLPRRRWRLSFEGSAA